MKVSQLSIFMENKPGQLADPCRALAEAGVNILTLSLADTQQFGVMRLVVDDCRTAKKALTEIGCVVKQTEVMVLEIEDRPGGLTDVLELIESEGVNVEYMYALTTRRDSKAALVFHFDDIDAAIRALQTRDVHLLGPADITRSTG